jgi:uncharacterized protein (DUF58 family)
VAVSVASGVSPAAAAATTASSRPPLLSPATQASLERLQLRSKRSLVGQLQGAHRSPQRGTSLDFADYRRYAPGDDVRRIDEHLFARSDVLALKLFDSEDDLTIRLVIDASGSMKFGDKLQHATRLAAALGFIGLVHRDVVRIHSLSELTALRATPSMLRRFNGRGAAKGMFDSLQTLVAGGGTPLSTALHRLIVQPGPPGVTIVFSDLLTAEWEQALRRLPPGRGSAMVIHVLDHEDISPTLVGDQELLDVETGQRIPVSIDLKSVEKFRLDALGWCDRVERRCHAGGVGYFRTMSNDPIEPTVRALIERSKRSL